MKFIRFILTCLATLAVLAALLVALAFAPPVQTWFARMQLADVPDLRVSLGSLSARFGKVEIEDAKLQYGDVSLALPSLEARLPLVDAVRRGKVLVGGLVAKGWTLDLSRLPDAERERALEAADAENAAPAASGPAKAAVRAFAGILSGWKLPFGASLDGVDLEGDVLVVAFPGKDPVRVHVTVKGGGAAAGREGTFEFSADTAAADQEASVHGRLAVAMDTPRIVGRAAVKAEASVTSGSFHEVLDFSASAALARGAGGETYSLELGKGGRNLATVLAEFSPAAQRFKGTWKLHLQDADVAAFASGRPLPLFSLAGNGRFDSDASFKAVHAAGRLSAVASRLGALSPALGRVGTATLGAAFDAVQGGQSLRFSRLDVSIVGERPVALFQALQPFDYDEEAGDVKASAPGTDWFSASLREFPLSWLPPLPGGAAFSSGNASGEFVAGAADGGFALRPKTPLTAAGVSLLGPGGTIARGLDLSLSMTASYAAGQLQLQWAPLAVASAGRRLATVEAKGSRPAGTKQPLAVTGKWSADLDALSSMPAVPALGWITFRSASGDFTASLGSSTDLQASVSLAGHDPSRTVTASISANSDEGGGWDFLVPVKIAFGPSASDISIEGSWGHQRSDPRTELKLTSENVALDQLLLLAAPLAAAGGAPLHSGPAAGAQAGASDRAPFWGDWVGTLAVAFDKLRTGDQEFTDVGGTFEVDHGSIQLEGGRGNTSAKSMARVEGSISFDPASEKPYSLAATLAPVANLDLALLLPPQPGQHPMIEGHFTLAGTVSGSGTSLEDLIGNTREEFKLSSTNGIIRLLQVNVADAVPEAAAPVSDSVEAVGDLVGSVLGIKGHSLDPVKNKVGTAAESVISFTNQVSEIGFDKVEATAIRGPDHTFHLVDLEMVSPDAHLRGTGQVTYRKGLPLSQEPLSLDLQLGVRDLSAKLLASVGLLSSDKDSLGYPLLNQPVRFTGTLEQIDSTQWHDLLAKAMSKPDAAKKDGAGGR